MCSAESRRPPQIQIRGPAPCRRSPCCSWSFPLRFGRPQTWKWVTIERSWGEIKGLRDRRQKCLVYPTMQWENQNTSWGLPCSGFSLCCIVHLLHLPNVLLFFSIIKLAYPLFTAGFKSSRIGLCTDRHLDDAFLFKCLVYLLPTKTCNKSNNSCGDIKINNYKINITDGNSRLSLLLLLF